MAMTLTEMVAAVKRDLKTKDYSDSDLEDIIGQVVVEVSDVSPYQSIEVLNPTYASKVLDISTISNLLSIDKIEYPVELGKRNYRNFKQLDNDTIEMDTTSAADVTGSGTLTGTVTFTYGSTTVTGSGTDFDGELAAGYLIKPSGGTRWYLIYSIESDTSLTLAEPLRALDACTDTINLTEYCYGIVRVYCDLLHTLSTSSTLNAKEEHVVLLGSVAKGASLWLNKTKEMINDANSRLTDNSTIESMGGRIQQAIDDLTSARTYINKINTGGRPQSDYIATSLREIQNATAYANETGAFLREAQHYLSLSSQIRAYQAWVDRATNEYKVALRTIAKRNIAESFPR